MGLGVKDEDVFVVVVVVGKVGVVGVVVVVVVLVVVVVVVVVGVDSGSEGLVERRWMIRASINIEASAAAVLSKGFHRTAGLGNSMFSCCPIRSAAAMTSILQDSQVSAWILMASGIS